MSAIFQIKQNDTSPILEFTCQDQNGVAVDITGATARFHMIAPDGTTKIDAAAAVTDGVNGKGTYSWDGGAGDTDTSGLFRYEVEITFVGGRIETFPNVGHKQLRVTDELA